MPHDIIDNREEKLAEHIGRLLDNAERAKFAVGYFFLSGFAAIREHLEKVDELRLLIGSTTNLKTIEALALEDADPEGIKRELERQHYQTPQEKRQAVDEASERLSKIAAQVPQTDEDEDYIKHLARLVKEGRIKVKVYTKGVLHAKVYIVDFKEGQYHTGAAIVGSSNLSLAGVTSNTELNVVVPGNENHAKLSKWFDDLWNDAEDFDAALMHVLQSSWAINEPTPYELYLKVVYELVRERLDEDEKVHRPRGELVPELYNYQRDAVIQARGILRDYGGVFLADVVGLGKTYMGAALLADLQARYGDRAIVICPPVLIPQWDEVLDLYQVDAKVFSRAMVHEVLEHDYLARRPIVLVDESHHFRNTNTKGYKALEELCYRKKVILVTATPYNTSAHDILSQMKLFHPSDTTAIPVDPANLKEYFRAVEKGEKKLPDLLEHVMVRRTRRNIHKYYPEDLVKYKLKFPKRLSPERVDYSIDDVYPGIFDKIEGLLKKIRYARYDLFHYIKAEYREEPELSQLKTAGKNLVALMRTMLFKRLESSVAAFRRSVSDQEEIHGLFLEQLRRGVVPAGLLAEEIRRYRITGDDDRLEAVIEQSTEKYPADKFEMVKFTEDIEADRAVFRQTHELVQDLKPEDDAKLQRLLELLRQEPLTGSKVLIFTEFATTAEYLGDQVTACFDAADSVSGSSKDIMEKVRRFAPRANKANIKAKDRLDILVTTDILSEGLNLQDCNIVVSYDLHWNPVRLIQRVGRVDRVSTEHEEIHTLNFLSEHKLESKLGLQERLARRFNEIHKHLGLDAKYLSEAEQLSNLELFTRTYTGDESVLEEDEEQIGVSLAELIKMMRDLRDKQPQLYKRITELPDKVRSARSADDHELMVFCKAGDDAALYLADGKGKVVSQDQMDILKKLKCDPRTPRVALPAGFNATVSRIAGQFQEDAQARLAELHAVESEVLARQTLKELSTLSRKLKGTEKKTIAELRNRLVRSPLSPKQKSELRRLRRRVDSPAERIQVLKELLLAQQEMFPDESEKSNKQQRHVSVQIIASEALVEKP